jgi:hypothetical protein
MRCSPRPTALAGFVDAQSPAVVEFEVDRISAQKIDSFRAFGIGSMPYLRKPIGPQKSMFDEVSFIGAVRARSQEFRLKSNEVDKMNRMRRANRKGETAKTQIAPLAGLRNSSTSKLNTARGPSSNSHHKRMSGSVVACPGYEPIPRLFYEVVDHARTAAFGGLSRRRFAS